MFRRQKTMFSRNIPSTSGAGAFTGSSGIELDATLKKIAIKMTEFLKLYLDGEIDTLREELSLNVFTDFSKKLFALKKNKQTDSEIVRTSVANTLTTLYSAISVYDDYQLEQVNNERLTTRVNILDDMDLLKDYLEELQRNLNTTAFGDHSMSVTSANVNPEHVAYIQQYGYPPNGVFDADLLGRIAQNIT